MFKKNLAVIALGLTVGLGGVAGLFMKQADAASVFAVTVQGSTVMTVGQSGNFTVGVTAQNALAMGDIVDVEIDNSANQKIFQQYFSGQNFVVNEAQPYMVPWTPSSTGNYTINVGVFGANWSGPITWVNSAAEVTVNAPAPVQSASPKFTDMAGATSISENVGQTGTIAFNIKNGASPVSGAIVDLEIYNGSNQKVFQDFFANQNFVANQQEGYAVPWTPSSVGTYHAEVGVFGANWSGPFLWDANMATITVSAPVVIPPPAAPVVAPPPVVVTTPAVSITNSVANVSSANNSGTKFYVSPNSDAATQAIAWQSSNPQGANIMKMIDAEPVATWFGGWNANVQADANTLVSAAQASGTMPILVAYNIPDRDCGGYSAGGAQTPSAYQSWINSFAAGIGSRPATVILEPDALASISCLSAADQTTRLQLLNYAVAKLKSLGSTKVYIDAGNSNWISAANMAPLLQGAGIAQADGFSLNVSNFYTTASNEQFGDALSALVGGKHFVIDTSRNGNGPTSDDEWCNPSGRALGITPTTNTGNALVDAFLWIKIPGESDGTCNSGPTAGTWWPQYAEGLAQNAGY